MDNTQNQTHQMVAWLDEERRKDKALIVKLEERTSSQAALIQDQNQRIQALEGEIAAMRASILTTSFFTDAITRLRNELRTDIEKVDQRRVAVQQDLKRIRDQDRETFNRALADIRSEFDTRFDREMQPRRVEEERLSRVAAELQVYADNLSKGLEEFERTLSFLEEQRRQDSKRIADTSGQVLDLAKRQETQLTKVELLEELSRRNERAVEEMQGTITEVRQQRQVWIEQEALASQRREQSITDVLRRMEQFETQAEERLSRISTFAETHREMKKSIDEFNRLIDRVDRRLNEATETQRLAEDRFRQEFEQFLQDDQKRWRQFTLTNEEAWRENGKSITELTTKVDTTAVQIVNVVDHVKHLHRMQEVTLRELADSFRTQWESVDDNAKTLPPLDQ